MCRIARRTGGFVAFLCGMLVMGALAALPAQAAATLFVINQGGLSFSSVLIGSTSPSQGVTVTNVSGSSVVLNDSGGTVSAPFARTTNCMGTLGAGGSCQFSFVFQPDNALSSSAKSAGILNGQAYSISMSGTGVVPTFDASTTSVTFGREVVGLDAAPTTIGITNVSPGPVVLAATGGGVGAPFTQSTDCTGTLPPGALCHETFGYHPTAAAISTATSTMTLNGQAIAVGLSGTGVAPTVRITGTKLSFGATVVGNSAPQQTVTVTNLSGQTITVAATGAAMSPVGPFSARDSCTGAILAFGQSCPIDVRFEPTTKGTANAKLTGTVNGVAFSINLTGKGVATVPSVPTFRITPAALSFGPVLVGSASPVQQVVMTNISSGPALAGGTTSHPGSGFDWTLASCPNPVPVGGSCVLNWTFTPTAAGPATATSVGTIGTQPISISMTGTGVTPKFNVTTANVNFGHWPVGTTATQQTVRITNISAGPVTMSGTPGTPAAPFVETSNCTGMTLNPGASCMDSFAYSPPVVTGSTGTATDTWNGQTITVALSGHGVKPTWLITPTKLNFGPVAVGNGLDEFLHFTSLSAHPVTQTLGQSPLPPDYLEFNTCSPTTVTYGQTCYIDFVFIPSSTGTFKGTASGTMSGGVPWKVKFTGTGVPPPT